MDTWNWQTGEIYRNQWISQYNKCSKRGTICNKWSKWTNTFKNTCCGNNLFVIKINLRGIKTFRELLHLIVTVVIIFKSRKSTQGMPRTVKSKTTKCSWMDLTDRLHNIHQFRFNQNSNYENQKLNCSVNSSIVLSIHEIFATGP